MPFTVYWTQHWWEEHTGRALRKQKKTFSGPFKSLRRAEECVLAIGGLALSWGTDIKIVKEEKESGTRKD